MSSNLTPAEAAKDLKISVRTLIKHVDAGDLSYILVGRGLCRRRMRFDMADLEAFKQRRRRTSACQSIDAPTGSLPSISKFEVFDFAARLAQNRSAPPKTSSGKSAN